MEVKVAVIHFLLLSAAVVCNLVTVTSFKPNALNIIMQPSMGKERFTIISNVVPYFSSDLKTRTYFLGDRKADLS